MLVWLGGYICFYITVSLSTSGLVSRVITRPLCNCLVKRSTMVQMFSLINILNCLPPLLTLCILKHVRMRLTILTGGGKSNHKIKIAETGQLAVSILPLDCKYTFLSFPKMLTALTTCTGRGGGRRVRE